MPSPNPEDDKSKCQAATRGHARQSQQRQTSRETQRFDAIPKPTNSGEPRNHSERSDEKFANPKLALQIIMTFATVGAFVAATFYACSAYNTLNEMHINAEIQLRPYVTLYNADGSAPIVVDPQGPIILFHFRNAGQTPARKFFLQVSGEWKGTGRIPLGSNDRPISHFERFEDVDPKKSIHIVIENPHQTAEIPANTTYIQGREGTGFWGSRGNPITIEGHFEYCDVFGNWHCSSFLAFGIPPANQKFWPMPVAAPGECGPQLGYITRANPSWAKQTKRIDRCPKGGD